MGLIQAEFVIKLFSLKRFKGEATKENAMHLFIKKKKQQQQQPNKKQKQNKKTKNKKKNLQFSSLFNRSILFFVLFFK